MLEVFQSLRNEFSSFKKTYNQSEVEMDQTSASASKPGPSNQAVEVDYGPALPPCLGADQPHENASDQPSSLFD